MNLIVKFLAPFLVPLLATAGLFMGGGWAYSAWELSDAQKKVRDLGVQLQKLQADASSAAFSADQRERAREEQFRAQQLENSRVQEKKLSQVMADAAAAVAARDGLRGAATQAAARSCPASQDPEAGYERDVARSSAGMLANVLDLIDQRAGALALYADSLRPRCERLAADYDSVSQ